eukprot:TRINITY_DN12081_c0_g1_i13.p1 TRINITY_DN12081_c0_g1~~TRINITY_DN12081_c0_g1_i13.p1  ORF type:complete len:452 (+),score=92.31 TRINITY_DN12081_c0_g1_i13:407-1762(+)
MLTDGLTDRGGVDTKPPDKKTQMIRNARARADKWSTKEIYEPDHLEIMKHGTMPVAHTNHFDFRQREKEKELSNDPFNVLKHYLPDKERAHKTQEMHSSLFLQREPFNPMMTGTKMMRQRDPIKELGPSMRYGVRTENERIVRELQRNSSLDHNRKDTKMLYFPEWKHNVKDEWVANKDFDLTTNMYQGPRVKWTVWDQIPIGSDVSEKYTDGYEVVGDLSRKREKSREFGRPEMITTVKKDVWETKTHVSQTMRTFKSQSALGIKPNYDEFSKNNRLTNYKSTLIKTGSVDKNVPFAFTISERGKETRDLIPITREKMYPKSGKHILAEKKVGETGDKLNDFNSLSHDHSPMSPYAGSSDGIVVPKLIQTKAPSIFENSASASPKKSPQNSTKKSFFSARRHHHGAPDTSEEGIKKTVSMYFDNALAQALPHSHFVFTGDSQIHIRQHIH